MLLAAWLNGKVINHLDVQERGFAYGDGIFSTIDIHNGQAQLLSLHWQRIQKSCLRLQITDDFLAQWQRDFESFMAHYPHCICKIIISRGCGGRGYLPDAQALPNCYFLAYQRQQHPASHQQGINTTFLEQCLGLNPLLAGHKHLNRLEQVLLRQELASLGYPEGIVCDIQGRVVEGVFSNLFMVKNHVIYTPDLQQAGVAGVMRQHILHLAQHLQYSVSVTDLLPSDFLTADEVFFCNSVYGIWPVKQLQDTLYSANPITQHLQANLYHV